MGPGAPSLLLLGWMSLMASSSPMFDIDYDNNCFLKDGFEFRYVSGSIHYFRIPPQYWRDRLKKMYMAGLNAIQIYIPWNFHEETPGVYNFQNDRDVEHFLDLANEFGLLVILRPGPYICAEWDMGGLPAWLLQKPNIILRSSDPDFLRAVDTWLEVLLAKMKPRLYQNGGNIISVQLPIQNPEIFQVGLSETKDVGVCHTGAAALRLEVATDVCRKLGENPPIFASRPKVENEYGSYYACDYNYLRHLKTKFQSLLGNEIVLFTTDGNSDKELRCGTLDGLYATVDFGPGINMSKAFEPQRRVEHRGPLVNSEYYTGWLDYWGGNHSTTQISKEAATLEEMLAIGASVNMYMFAGGTNFGYWSGADYKKMFKPITTSYDYDAPLSEAGDPTDKLDALRSVIGKYKDVPAGPMPPATVKQGYGYVPLKKDGELLRYLDVLSPHAPVLSVFPLTFEQLGQYFGLVLYRTIFLVNVPVPTPLTAPHNAVHDLGYVMVNGVYMGVLERDHSHVVNVMGRMGDRLDILVENMGRLNFGANFNDLKGLVGNLTIGHYILEGWEMYPLNIDDAVRSGWIQTLPQEKPLVPMPSTGPTFYSASFQLPGPSHDTFLKLSPWTKGQVWLNGFNLGRYWSKKGPQETLFVPAMLLEESLPNNLTILELMGAPAKSWGLFIDRPILNGNGTQIQVVVEFN